MAELTVAALEAAIAKLGNAPKRPDLFVMNWSTWCKSRHALKELGIPVRYVRVARHRWKRYVEGVQIHITPHVEGDDIYSLYTPPNKLFARTEVAVYHFGRRST